MKKKIVVIISFLLSGCMVGPKIEKPNISMPTAYDQKISQDVQDKISLDKWWEYFNDEDLNKYINIAIANNLDLKIAIEKIEETRSLYRIEKANLLPEVEMSAAAIRQGSSKNTISTTVLSLGTAVPGEGITSAKHFFQFGFDATWELDFFGKLRRSKQAACFAYQKEKDSALDIYITLLSDVAKTYINIITLKNKLIISEKKLSLAYQIYDLIIQKFDSGLSNEILEKEEYKTIQGLKEDIANLTTSYKSNIYRLAILLSREPENFEKEFDKVKDVPESIKEIEIGLPSDLLRRRPDIRKAEKFLYEQTANVGVAVAELFPSFSLVGTFNYESSKAKTWFRWSSKTWGIGPSFDFPLLDFGRRLANVDVKKSEQRQAVLSYKNTVLSALEDVENALVAYFYEKNNYLYVSEKLNAQRKITTLKQDLFQSGLNSEILFLQTQTDLLDIENEYLDKKRGVSVNLISLIKALGGGW